MDLPGWVNEAAALPIVFAQVREDPLLDERVTQELPDGFAAALVASGGCTAAWLAARSRASHLHLIDLNPAQVALSLLKLRLLETAPPEERLRLLGHAPLSAGTRARRLGVELDRLGLAPEALGPTAFVAERGPDHSGRYELVFSELRAQLAAAGMQEEVRALCALRDPRDQSRRVDVSTALGRAMDEAFARAMSLPILVRLFGEAATQNSVEPFAAHFARRTRHALATLPACENPYLSQVLLGRYPRDAPAPWLSARRPDRLPRITWETRPMADALRAHEAEFDLVHLSNILDWLSEEEARDTLRAACSSLRRGGTVVIRQLNSTLDIRGLSSGLLWNAEESARLHGQDRSYFYRAIHVGRKG